MMKIRVPPTAEYATSKTVVWWDMNNCPVPNGYDPSRIGLRIDTELKKLGYNGPLTIIAYGNLEGIPDSFLRGLSSGGIVLKHIIGGLLDIWIDFWKWLEENLQTPVTVMFIAESCLLENVISDLCRKRGGYNFLLAYPTNEGVGRPYHSSSLVVCGEWLWDRSSLLKDLESATEETRRLERVVEMNVNVCEACHFDSPIFDDFITHLNSNQHAHKLKELNRYGESVFMQQAKDAAKARKAEALQEKVRSKKSKRHSKFRIHPKYLRIAKSHIKGIKLQEIEHELSTKILKLQNIEEDLNVKILKLQNIDEELNMRTISN